MREEERQAKAKPKPKARPPPKRDEGKVLVFTKEGSESAAETKAALLSEIVKTGANLMGVFAGKEGRLPRTRRSLFATCRLGTFRAGPSMR